MTNLTSMILNKNKDLDGTRTLVSRVEVQLRDSI